MLFSASTGANIYYDKAYRQGKKESGSLLVLDDILRNRNITGPKEVSLGLVDVPISQIVGTKTSARAGSFSSGFYPILEKETEFGAKWISLCNSHLEEGIKEPVKAYEFMNKFYISEGNKRVSVLKFFGAVSVPAYVTRIIPPLTPDKECVIYYEFMDFYRLSGINYIYFSKIGSFAKLQRLMGKLPNEKWTDKDREDFGSLYARFKAECDSVKRVRADILTGDALLFFINLYDYDVLCSMSVSELHSKFEKTREEFMLLKKANATELQTDPSDSAEKTPLLKRLIPLNSPVLNVAFIYEYDAETSGWTYAHERGRLYLNKTFADQINTCFYDHADTDNIENVIKKAIDDKNNIIFTAASAFFKASLKQALENPDVKILNSSLNVSQRHMRTYYTRIYESKFLMGAIAGAMAGNDLIGYLADCPVYGTAANINAFAMGAKMINPRAKIYLEWRGKEGTDIDTAFDDYNVTCISGLDVLYPNNNNRHFGLYKNSENRSGYLAAPVQNWGKFYEKIIRSVMTGSWESDDPSDSSKALNYWWGMSAGVADVIYSNHLPIGTMRLIDLLKQTICAGNFNPFSGVLYSQRGLVRKKSDGPMLPEEIITMNWLAENVIGSFPDYEELDEVSKKRMSLQNMNYLE